MPAIILTLLPLLSKILSYVIVVGGMVVAYFAIRRSGAKAERDKLQQELRQAQEQIRRSVGTAETKDQEIDQKVRGQIEEIRKTTDSSRDIFHF